MNKNNLLKTLPLIFVLLLGYSCKYKCPAYDLSDRTIIPFRQGDTITYVSNAFDTIKLVVKEFYAEPESEFKGLYMDYECDPKAYYIAVVSSPMNFFIKEQHDWEIQIYFGQEINYTLPWRASSVIIENDMSMSYENGKEIRGRVYQYVMEVKDKSNRRRIDKFIKVGYYGILEFHDKETDLTWIQLID
jgi:hypothetical protein